MVQLITVGTISLTAKQIVPRVQSLVWSRVELWMTIPFVDRDVKLLVVGLVSRHSIGGLKEPTHL